MRPALRNQEPEKRALNDSSLREDRSGHTVKESGEYSCQSDAMFLRIGPHP